MKKILYFLIFTVFLTLSIDELEASCIGSCGGLGSANCWCDDSCWTFGDCCSDVCTWCGTSSTTHQTNCGGGGGPGPGTGCSTDNSICTPGVAGPFNFTTASGQVSSCLDFWNGINSNNYGYVLLEITQSGPLNLLINGNNTFGFVDVAVFIIPSGQDPCVAITSIGNQIGCNYASAASGCAQFGSHFACPATIPAPNVNTGDLLMIVVEDWSNAHTSYTLQLGPAPGAQTGYYDLTLNPAGPFCISDGAVNLTAATGGGEWSGIGITNSNLGTFNPGTAGVGTHTITYTMSGNCGGTSTMNVDVTAVGNPQIFSSGPFCENDGTIMLEAAPVGGTWSGTGIINASTGSFNPAIVGGGNSSQITYTTGGSCSGTTSVNFSVLASQTPTITPAGPFCSNANTFTLSANIAGGLWSGNGITNGTLGTFNPTVAGSGSHTITYTLTTQCGGFGTTSIEVIEFVQSSVNPVSDICDNEPAFNLSASPSSGIWSGIGITNSSNGTFNPQVSGAGSFTITYSLSGSCSQPATVNINVLPTQTPNINPAGSFCNNSPEVILTTDIPGGNWSGTGITNSTNGTFNPNSAGIGSHTIIYSLPGQCGNSHSITIDVIEFISPVINPVADLCDNEPAFNLTASHIGGTWSGTGITNANNGTFNPAVSGSGSFTVTYTLGGSCTQSATTNINVIATQTPTITPAGHFCTNTPETNLTVDIAGGIWSGTGITNNSTGTFNPAVAGAGNHTITYELSTQCGESHSVIIEVIEKINAVINSVQNICENYAAFNFMATPAGGVWSGNGITNTSSGTFHPATAGVGTHTVYYEISGLCGDIDSFEIEVLPDLTPEIGSIGQLCSTDSEIQLFSIPSGGTWNGTGIIDVQSGIFSPQAAGIGLHLITYETSGLCGSIDSIIIDVTELTTDFSYNGDQCFDNHLVQFTNQSTGNLQCYWSFGDGTVSSANNPNHIYQQPGSYAVTLVCSNNACTDSISKIVSIYPEPDYSASLTQVDCNGNCNGEISISPNQQGDIYFYDWDSGLSPIGVQSNLCEGTYQVTVSTASGCSAQETYVISEPTLLTANLTAANSSCYQSCDGSISALASGGTAPYNYQWLNLPAGDLHTDFCAGVYAIEITDANACVFIDSTEITEPIQLAIISSTKSDESCSGACNGEIEIHITGGSGNYNYAWSGPPGFSGVNSNQISGLCGGNYQLVISDDNGCSVTFTESIISQNQLSIDFTLSNFNGFNVSCNGLNDGEITANVIGGTLPFNYQWSVANSGMNELSNLASGVYFLTVTDNNGCFSIDSVVLTEPSELTLYLSAYEFAGGYQISCYENNDGSIQSSTIGNVGNVIYNWNNGQYQTADINQLEAGIYTLDIVDENGCTASSSIQLNAPSPILITFDIPLQNGYAIACHGESSGEINLTATGGSGNFTYNWNNGFSQSQDLKGISAGEFFVSVTDENNCVSSDTVWLNEPIQIEIEYSSLLASCLTANNGLAEVIAIGGVESYQYQWSGITGNSESSSNQLLPGDYTVIVTDANGCSESVIINVGYSAIADIELYAIDDTIFLGQSTTIGISDVNQLDLPVTYSWSTSGGDITCSDCPNPVVSPQITTIYSATLTDVNGCQTGSEITVFVLPERKILYTPNVFSPNGDNVNDIFYIETSGVSQFYLSVFDRWGTMVYESNNPNSGWDGTFKGFKMPEEIYIYYLSINFQNGDREIRKGSVSLIR